MGLVLMYIEFAVLHSYIEPQVVHLVGTQIQIRSIRFTSQASDLFYFKSPSSAGNAVDNVPDQ